MMQRTTIICGLACFLSGCLLPPTRFGTEPCIDGVHKPRHYAILPADITIFASPTDESAIRTVQPETALRAMVAALEIAGHRVKGSVDVGGRVQSAQHKDGIRQVLHPSDIHALRVALYEKAEKLSARYGSNRIRLSVDKRLTGPVYTATGADASLYLYVSAYVEPERRIGWRDVGDAAKEIGKGVVAFAVGVALLGVVGHLSIGVGTTGRPPGDSPGGRWRLSASWSSSNLRGKRFEWRGSGGARNGFGIAGPIIVARSQTPVITPLPCVTCDADAAPDNNQLSDPSNIPPTLVGTARHVADSEISATLVAVDNRTGTVLWASSQYGPDVSLTKAGMLDRLVTRFAEKLPRCGMKPWKWDRKN
jgi:hypothetical protein